MARVPRSPIRWRPEAHPRHPAGTRKGGQFARVLTAMRGKGGLPPVRTPERPPRLPGDYRSGPIRKPVFLGDFGGAPEQKQRAGIIMRMLRVRGIGGLFASVFDRQCHRGDFDPMDWLEERPRKEDEPYFMWAARAVDGLDGDMKHEMIFQIRERYDPVTFVADGADRYRESKGLPNPQVVISEVRAPLDKATAVGKAFALSPDESADPDVRAAFEDFKRQNAEMWDFMTKPFPEGMGIKVEFIDAGGGEPYESAYEQAMDVQRNHRIKIQSGLGGDHTLMTRLEYDRFRAVHDVFGHVGVGGGFDRHGEYQAWLAHMSMYTMPGRDAMSSEYHGVNTAMWTRQPGGGTGKAVVLDAQYIRNPWDEKGYLRPGAHLLENAELSARVARLLELRSGWDRVWDPLDHPRWLSGPQGGQFRKKLNRIESGDSRVGDLRKGAFRTIGPPGVAKVGDRVKVPDDAINPTSWHDGVVTGTKRDGAFFIVKLDSGKSLTVSRRLIHLREGWEQVTHKRPQLRRQWVFRDERTGQFGHGNRATKTGRHRFKRARSIFRHIGRHGGITYQPVTNRSPKRGFAIAIPSAQSVAVDRDEFNESHVKQFLDDNREWFDAGNVFLGVWDDEEGGKVWMELAQVEPSRSRALDIASSRGEIAIFDLEKGEAVEAAGRNGDQSSPLARAFLAGSSTQDMHRIRQRDGSYIYTPARQRLHDQIVDRMLEGARAPANGKPEMVFTAGGPASGKSTVIGAMDFDGFARIDPDWVKEQLPEWQEVLDSDIDPEAKRKLGTFVHAESNDVVGLAIARAQQRGLNIFQDGSGNGGPGIFASKIMAARDKGYSPRVIYANVGVDEAIRRAEERGRRSGRFMAPGLIRDYHRKVSEVFASDIMRLNEIDVEVWDTSGRAPRRIWHRQGGKVKSADQEALMRFVLKRSEGG